MSKNTRLKNSFLVPVLKSDVRVTRVDKVVLAWGRHLLRGRRRPPPHFVLRNLVATGYVLLYHLPLDKKFKLSHFLKNNFSYR